MVDNKNEYSDYMMTDGCDELYYANKNKQFKPNKYLYLDILQYFYPSTIPSLIKIDIADKEPKIDLKNLALYPNLETIDIAADMPIDVTYNKKVKFINSENNVNDNTLLYLK